MTPDQWLRSLDQALARLDTLVLEGTVTSLAGRGKTVTFSLEGDNKSIPCRAPARLMAEAQSGTRIAVTGTPILAGTTPRLSLKVDTMTMIEASPPTVSASAPPADTPNHRLAWPSSIRTIGLVCPVRGSDGRKDFTTIVRQHLVDVRWRVKPTPMSRPSDGPKIAAAIAAAARGVDVVAIIRGGGPAGEMEAFNSQRVTDAIDLATVPVISGIGHATDQHEADRHSHTACLTPTDAAYKLTGTGR